MMLNTKYANFLTACDNTQRQSSNRQLSDMHTETTVCGKPMCLVFGGVLEAVTAASQTVEIASSSQQETCFWVLQV